MRISDWSSDVCSSDLLRHLALRIADIDVGRQQHAVARIEEAAVGERRDAADIAFGRVVRRLQALDLAARGIDAENGMIEYVLRGDEQALAVRRSEEHTYELQSLMRISYAVFCLKKKNNI